MRIKHKRLLVFMLLSLIPFAIIVFGISMLFLGGLFSGALPVTCFYIPIAIIGLLWLIVNTKENSYSRIALLVTALVILLLVLFLYKLVGDYEGLRCYEGDEAIERYSEIQKPMMPSIDDVGKASKYEYYNYFCSYAVFSSETYTLICQYDNYEYEVQKAKLDKKYIFQTKHLYSQWLEFEPKAKIGDYSFKLLSIEGEYEELYYPQQMVVIATNDKTREIVYLFFEDYDLDYIESFREFVYYWCGWTHIREIE